MLNSILMLGSCNNKNKKISNIFTIIMIINLIIVQFNQMSLKFLVVNLLIMCIISLNCKIIKNTNINNIVSVLSIGIWSILIDTISYFMFPLYSGTSLIHYIFMGLIFNIKYIFVNLFVICGIEVISYIYKVIRKKEVVLNTIKNNGYTS